MDEKKEIEDSERASERVGKNEALPWNVEQTWVLSVVSLRCLCSPQRSVIAAPAPMPSYATDKISMLANGSVPNRRRSGRSSG